MGRGGATAGGRLYKVDQSWMVWTKCKVCQRRICVNNYQDHEVRVTRRRGVVVCHGCDTEAAVELYKLAKELAALSKVEKPRKHMRKLAERAWRRIHGED